MVIFWRLLFGHFLADFTFQSDFINRWKRGSLMGMLAHCGIHPICYAALTYPYLGDTWVELPRFPLKGWLCVLLVFAGHFIEDQWRVFTIFKYGMPDNTLYFLWDQLIHYAMIFAVIPVAFKGGATTLMPESWPVLGCLFVLVTHACTVLIYFIEKDLSGKHFPGPEEKYATMGERLVLALLFLIPGHFWVLLVLAWTSLMHTVRRKRLLDLTWLSFYLGGAAAAACGLMARMIFYYR